MPYKPFLIRKQADGAKVYNSAKRWGVYCTGFPFKVIGEAKDIPSRSWNDEHGDEEYIPETLPIKSYELEVEFACKGTPEQAKSNIDSFFAYLTGRDTDKGETDSLSYGSRLEIYDTLTLIGKQDCRYMSYDNKGYETQKVFDTELKEEACITFSVKFKINDPNTNITLKEE
jgi:hypothetical protein